MTGSGVTSSCGRTDTCETPVKIGRLKIELSRSVEVLDSTYFQILVLITASVRSTREGNVLTSVCPSIHPSVCPQGGVPISHNALQHFPECHEAVGGTWTPPGGTRTPPGGTQTPPGGTRTPPGGYPDPPRPGQKEYSLHGGRYASCVHAGGLSCFFLFLFFTLFFIFFFAFHQIRKYIW